MLLNRGELWHNIAISTQRVLIGFAVGAGSGLLLGGLVGLSRPVRSVLGPTIAALRAGYKNVNWFRGGLPEWRAAGRAVNITAK